MKNDPLVTCPDCGTPNIYQSKLEQHRRGKNCASRRATKSQALVPTKPVRKVTLADLDVMPARAPEGDEWENARRYSHMAEGFSQATVVAQIMCGFELIELQKRMCATRGGDRKSGSKPNDSVLIPWPKLVKEKIGRSDDTARNWMNMARAVQPRLKKLDGPWQAPTLLALPPSEWPEEARESVEKSLRGICEGHTQIEFMRELGLAKKPPGNGGGRHSASDDAPKLTPQQAAEQSAQDLFHPLSVELFRASSEGEREKLFHLPIVSDAPGDVTGLTDLAEHARAFLKLVETALEEKKKAVRGGGRK